MTVSARTWARIGAVAFIVFALLVSVLSARQGRPTPAASVIPPAQDPATADPLVVELYHCQALGQAGASDPDCLRAWAENRRRFLAPGAPPEAAASTVPAAPSDGQAAAPSKDGQP
jgi:conjugative transfer region protein TrbK